MPRQECRYTRGFDSLPTYLVAQPHQALQGGAIPGARRVARESRHWNGGEDLADRGVTQPDRSLAPWRRHQGLPALRREARGICGGGNDQPGGLSGELILGRMELEKMSGRDVRKPV